MKKYNLNLNILIYIFTFNPYLFYLKLPEYKNLIYPILKTKINIIIRFLRNKIKLRYLYKCYFFNIIENNILYTKNTLIKFIFLNYEYHFHDGLPEIIIGSYNINSDLLIDLNNKTTKWIRFYYFLKKNEINKEMILSFI